MINYDEIFPVGKLEKTHGLNGEISFNFTTDVFDTAEAPFFILEVQGILVPFYIESYRFKTDSTGLLKFEGIDTEEKARELWGHELYLPKTYIDQMDEKEIGLEYFVGFEIHDTSGIIGTITEAKIAIKLTVTMSSISVNPPIGREVMVLPVVLLVV